MTSPQPSYDDVDDLDALEAELDRAAGTRAAVLEQSEAPPAFDTLEAWVQGVFCPTYARRSTPTFRWCSQWWRHPEAIVRLEALWRSWESLRTDPRLGMAVWLRDHLDHQLPLLTHQSGPLAGCEPDVHFPPQTDRLAHQSAPAGWWPPQDDLQAAPATATATAT